MSTRIPPLSANLGQACYNCFKETETRSSGAAFSRCSQCKRVVYCSSACQKANWSNHKKFCKAWQALSTTPIAQTTAAFSLADAPSTDFGFLNMLADEQAQNVMQFLRLSLGRPPSIPERNLIGWEPRCLACARTDRHIRPELARAQHPAERHLLKPCTSCSTSFYCSSAHWEAVEKLHTSTPCDDGHSAYSQCHMNQDIRLDVRISQGADSHGMVWAPNRRMSNWEPLAERDWTAEFEEPMKVEMAAALPPGPVTPFLRSASEGLSMPMTILWALENLYDSAAWTNQEELIIHLVGAHDKEMTYSMVFEEILHRLPAVKRLRLVLCGPQLRDFSPETMNRTIEMDTCPSCKRQGRKRIQEHYGLEYHLFIPSARYTTPSLAVAFNSGCSQEDTAAWQKTINVLVEKKIPTIFTAYNREEAEAEAEILRRHGARLVSALGPCKNPWGSMLAKPEPNKVTGFYAVNGWLAGGFN